jgi:hypothetical protein
MTRCAATRNGKTKIRSVDHHNYVSTHGAGLIQTSGSKNRDRTLVSLVDACNCSRKLVSVQIMLLDLKTVRTLRMN